MMCDPDEYVAMHTRELMAEAENDRLAGQLTHRPSFLRRELALVCHRLAQWLDAGGYQHPARYDQPAEPGLEAWIAPTASA